MSANIDERLVQMKFDNSQFESNAQQTLSTLDKLDKGLEFKNSGKGLTDLQGTMNRFNFGAIENGVASLTHSFSAFDVAAMTIINRLTNKVVDAGEKIGKALTIQGAMDGFKEYELKMGSIQTILMGAKNLDGTAVSLEQVNQKLQELNTYSDKTIYSFRDMTDNISKFTNAGVDLDTAVTAIQGIANEAALSGANAQQASRAMYNFSQALSAGYVKLIDWKSIENAQMATVGFKEALLETAKEVGTVEKTSDGMYKVLTKGVKGGFKENVSASKNFNDSLSAQWMTTEVLTKTLAKYTDESTELGKKAFEAATEVKTFSQLMDTLKEAVGSGWAQSFELIVGDFNQAKQLWTGVNNVLSKIVDDQAKARNKLLEGWSKGGGRANAIEAIKNAWNGLSGIVTKASEAMDHVFPDITVKKLLDITQRIKDLTQNFKMSSETSHNVYNTFKGLFSIIDIGVHGITFLAGAFKPLIKLILDAASKFFEITGNLGEFLDGVDKTIEKSDTFKEGLSGIKDGIVEALPPLDNLKDVMDAVGDGLDKFIDKIIEFTGGLDEKGTERLSLLALVMEGFGKLGELAGKGLDRLGEGIGKLKEKISELGLDGVIKILKNLLYGKLLVSIIKLIEKFTNAKETKKTIFDTIKETFSSFKGIPETIGKIGDSFGEFLEKMQKTKTLDAISKSIAILAASLFVLSFVDADKIGSALGGISIMLFEVIAALKILESTNSGGGKDLSKLGTTMIKMSVSILVLAVALKQLTDINMDQLGVGLAGISILLVEMLAVAMVLSSSSGNIKKGATSLILFAVALKVMAGVVKDMSTLDMDALGTGLAGVGVMLLYLVGAAAILGKVSGFGISAGLGMVALAASLIILSKAVDSFGSIDAQAMQNGITAMTAVLAIVGIFSAMMSGGNVNMAGIGAGLILMSVGIVILSGALSSLSSLSLDEIGRGLLALGGAMLILGVVGKMLGEVSGKLIGVSTAFLIFGVAVNAMVPAMQALGQLNVAEICTGLAALAGVMIIFGVASAALSSEALAIIGVSVALGIFAISINLLVPALQALAGMGVENLIVSIGGLAAVLLVFGVAATLLTPVIPMMFLLAGALILLGVACVALGGGLTMLTLGIQTFGQFIVSVFSDLGGFLGGVFGTIGEIGSGLLGILGKAKEGISSLFSSGGTKEEAGKAVDDTAKAINDNSSKVTGATDTLKQNAINSLSGLPDAYGGIGVTSIESFTNGLGSVDFSSVTNAIGQQTSEGLDISDATNNLGLESMTAYVSGMESGSGDVTGAIGNIGDTLNTDLASISKNFDTKGSESVALMGTSMTKNKGKVETGGKNAAGAGVKGAKSKNGDYQGVGKSADEGIAKGMRDYTWIVDAASRHVANSAVNTAKSTIQSHSPSKVFEKLGMYSDQGFANGLIKYAGLVSDASGNMAKGTLTTLQDTMARAYELADDDSFHSPTITPVMDLSEIQNGANSIPGMLSGYSLSLANTNNAMNNERMARNQANSLASLFGGLKNAIMNQQPSNNYNINGITYDDGSNIANAMQAIANAAIIEGRM